MIQGFPTVAEHFALYCCTTPKRHKLGRRVDLPPLDEHGPWLKEPPRRTPSEIVHAMRDHRFWLRSIPLSQLVPEEVRAQSAERWRIEHEALLANEDEDRRYLETRTAAWDAWCSRPWWQRLVDCAFREKPPARPRGPGHVPFADITIIRRSPSRPDYGLQNGYGHRLDSSFDCPMPRHDEAP